MKGFKMKKLLVLTTLCIIMVLTYDIVYQVPAFGLELVCLIVIELLLIHDYASN